MSVIDPRLEQVMARYDGTAKAWLNEAYPVVHRLCLENREVTALMIWPHLPFPPSCTDGRVFGKVMRVALRRRWLAKAKDAEGVWRAYDHIDHPAVKSKDGVVIRQKALIPVYHSLIFDELGLAGPHRECRACRPPRLGL